MSSQVLILMAAAITAGVAAEIPNVPALMPRDKEVALALSAAPEHLRANATVYVLEAHGFTKVREGAMGSRVW